MTEASWGAYSAVIVKLHFGGIYGERVFQAPPLFEETFVTPQCDFTGGLPLRTADACLSWTAVVAGDSHRTTVAIERHSFFGKTH